MIARRLRLLGLSASLVLLAVSALGAQNGSVRVTATRANVRAEASETSTVLTQVAAGTILALLEIEGDWFHVRLPPDARLGGAQVDAYISKKVAKLEAAPADPSAGATGATPSGKSAPAAASASAPVAITSRDGMSVALVAGDATTWMPPGTARIIQVPDKVDALARLAATLTTTAAPPAAADSAQPVTYVWVVDAPTSANAIADRRPSFVAQFKDVPGVGADDLVPVIVRLAPAAGEARLIAALRGRADQGSRAQTDWDVFKDLKQDVIRSTSQTIARGTVRIQPAADLPPGEYAVVLRLLNARKKLSGATLLHNDAEGRAFGIVWDFRVGGTGLFSTVSAVSGTGLR